ncbi:RNA polymerase sigma-70 factor [Puia sp. P3]|uniref:RNA polymerase sigma-70 factor n=1 Tax=Puia sp. P3 TaxID=3423952 RepID=UPI003D66D4F9
MSTAETEQYHQFQAVFRTWYSPLCNYAVTFTKDPDISEDIVQDLFVKIWEQRRGLLTETSIRYYLFTAVRNNCITWLRREKQQATIPFADDQANDLTEDAGYAGDAVEPNSGNTDGLRGTGGARDEMVILQEGIGLLPPKCREVFLLSRFSQLSYKEIAESLGISPKTVENQLGKALRMLRAYLKANGVGPAFFLSLIFP